VGVVRGTPEGVCAVTTGGGPDGFAAGGSVTAIGVVTCAPNDTPGALVTGAVGGMERETVSACCIAPFAALLAGDSASAADVGTADVMAVVGTATAGVAGAATAGTNETGAVSSGNGGVFFVDIGPAVAADIGETDRTGFWGIAAVGTEGTDRVAAGIGTPIIGTGGTRAAGMSGISVSSWWFVALSDFPLAAEADISGGAAMEGISII
jgi:hypothetical protein